LSLFFQIIKEWDVVTGTILLNNLILDERAFAVGGVSWLKTSTSGRKKKETKKLEELTRRRGAVLDGELLSSVESEGVPDGPGTERVSRRGSSSHFKRS
jgi:hypothetical protein